MKKFQFLLVDAGPIIKLFELGIWDDFIKKCDVTITRTIANEAKYARQDFEDICIDLDPYENQGLINIQDVTISDVKKFIDRFNKNYRENIDDGEKEMLALLSNSSDNWLACSADRAVFKVLALLGKSEQGISLQEILKSVGLGTALNWKKISPQSIDWKYTKKFRLYWTRKGEVDFIQGQRPN